jgi:outer membrane receptor protein involved in Fe transport
MGVNSGDGRGNITAYATVFDSKEVLQGDRDYSACSLNPATGTSFTCGGSTTSAPGRFITFNGGVLNWAATDDPDAMRPYDFANDLYNFGPLNHYQRPERRYNLGAMGHYEFNEHADVYTQLMFNQYESIAQIAPGGSFGETSTINCGNPLIPANIVDALGCTGAAPTDVVPLLVLRRNIEGGGRQQSFDNSSFRIVTGLRGAINDGWSYDVSAQYAQGTGTQSTLNNFQKDRVAKALTVLPDANGDPQCASFLDGTDLNCLPYNPFVLGGITPEQLAYLQVTGVQVGRITQEIYNGIVTGDLGAYGIKLPSASDGIQLVFGAEYRRDTLTNTVDALQEAFQLTGSGGPTIGIDGATKVEELFMEARVPLAQDQAWADSLSFDTAYRYSDYGDGVQTDTYKLGLEWAPIADVRLRGSYQRAVRAANIVELFTAQGFNLFDAPGDPCGVQAPSASAADCIATGVPAANVFTGLLDSPAGQYSFLQGGNTALTPEESDTYSYGVVFQPRFAPGLAITVDYFDISIDDAIQTFGPNNTLTACYSQNDQAACDRINRDPATGALWLGNGHVENLNINIGSLETTGWDVNVGYSGLEMGRFGSLAFNLTGTYVVDLTYQPAPGIDLVPGPSVNADTFDCVGFYSSECGTPTPQWRHRFRTSWQTPWDLDLSLTWRFYGEVTKLDQSRLVSSPTDLDHNLPAEDYFDLAANWAVTEKTSVTLGINNVLDDNPSLSGAVGTTGNGNTYPQTYDALGRYVFVRATVEF